MTEQVTVHHGDALTVLAGMPDGSVDAVVTDPPYGLEFMGREWDAPWKYGFAETGYTDGKRMPRPNYGSTRNPMCRACRKHKRGTDRCYCETPDFDESPADSQRLYQAWCERWAAECLRLLRPGGHLLAFGGTRTFHRLTCAIEDAGFEIRDTISWLYGSGFPKSLDVSKAIDRMHGAEREVVGPSSSHGMALKPGPSTYVGEFHDRPDAPNITAPATEDARRWRGFGTALKPGWEPIVVARKPLAGTVAANVVAHGTGALNIDAGRIGIPEDKRAAGTKAYQRFDPGSSGKELQPAPHDGLGRWPANVALDEAAAAELDRQSGTSVSTAGKPRGAAAGDGWGMTATGSEYDDIGGASRFYFTAKAAPDERPRVDGVSHPTVKPLDLVRWLVRLVTPPGGLVLDPFAGSGTTGEACLIEGFRCVLAENHEPYLPLIQQRLSKPIQPVLGEAIA